MKRKIYKIMSYKNMKKFCIFSIVGFIIFLIDLACFNLLFKLLESFAFANVLSWFISTIFNFMINRNFTFKAKKGKISKQIIKWAAVYCTAFIARILTSEGVLRLISEEGTLGANIAFLSGIAISIPISFFGSLLWAFKK